MDIFPKGLLVASRTSRLSWAVCLILAESLGDVITCLLTSITQSLIHMAELVTCSIDPVCSLSQSVICFVQPVRNSIMFTHSPSHLLIWSYLLAHSVSWLLTHLLNHTWWYTLVDDWIICSLNSVACSLSCSIAPPSDQLKQSPEETGTKKAFFALYQCISKLISSKTQFLTTFFESGEILEQIMSTWYLTVP